MISRSHNSLHIGLEQGLLSRWRQRRSMKRMLPARCHHNPNCLPISFLMETEILLFEAVYRISRDKISSGRSILCSAIADCVHCLVGLSTWVNHCQSMYASTMKEHQLRCHRRSRGRPLAVTHGEGEVYSSPKLVRRPLAFRMTGILLWKEQTHANYVTFACVASN